MAVATTGSPNTAPHSATERLLVTRVEPRSYHAMVDVYSEEKITEYMEGIRGVIANCTRVMPTHEEFIAKHCAAKPM